MNNPFKQILFIFLNVLSFSVLFIGIVTYLPRLMVFIDSLANKHEWLSFLQPIIELKEINWLGWLTLLAIVVALFREKLYGYFIKADLKITAIPDSELAHEVDDRNPKTDKLREKQYWYGIRITNVGLVPAQNVQVYFKGLETNVKSIKDDFVTYNIIPLRKSWIHGSLIKHLPKKVSIRWDICYLHKKKNKQNIMSFKFLRTPNALKDIKCEANKVSRFKF